MAQEFERGTRAVLSMPPAMQFPERGLPEDAVLDGVRDHLKDDPYETPNNFGISYVGPPHPIADKAAKIAAGTVFVDWATDMFPGTRRLEKEAVRMVGSLLGTRRVYVPSVLFAPGMPVSRHDFNAPCVAPLD